MATGGGVKIEFTLEGHQELVAALKRLEDLPGFFAVPFWSWTFDVTDQRLAGMSNYPPPPPNSTYHRTGEFAGGWSTHDMGPSKVEFLNTAPHADLVAGEDQAWMHAGRWWRAFDRIEAAVPDLMKYLETALEEWVP